MGWKKSHASPRKNKSHDRKNKSQIMEGLSPAEKKSAVIIDNNTIQYQRDDGRLAIRLHNTDVAALNLTPKSMVVKSGGWHTKTTQDRINNALKEYGFQSYVHQKNFTWYVIGENGKREEFKDGMEITY